MDGFFQKVYDIVQQIPKGKVTTYGHIAKMLGNKRQARQVGWALHANKTMIVIPCHRVVNRFGHLSDAFVFGGIQVQTQLLKEEGVIVCDGCVDLEKYLWSGQ